MNREQDPHDDDEPTEKPEDDALEGFVPGPPPRLPRVTPPPSPAGIEPEKRPKTPIGDDEK
jgi:hypothetical protein